MTTIEDRHLEREQRESYAQRLESTFPSVGCDCHGGPYGVPPQPRADFHEPNDIGNTVSTDRSHLPVSRTVSCIVWRSSTTMVQPRSNPLCHRANASPGTAVGTEGARTVTRAVFAFFDKRRLPIPPPQAKAETKAPAPTPSQTSDYRPIPLQALPDLQCSLAR